MLWAPGPARWPPRPGTGLLPAVWASGLPQGGPRWPAGPGLRGRLSRLLQNQRSLFPGHSHPRGVSHFSHLSKLRAGPLDPPSYCPSPPPRELPGESGFSPASQPLPLGRGPRTRPASGSCVEAARRRPGRCRCRCRAALLGPAAATAPWASLLLDPRSCWSAGPGPPPVSPGSLRRGAPARGARRDLHLPLSGGGGGGGRPRPRPSRPRPLFPLHPARLSGNSAPPPPRAGAPEPRPSLQPTSGLSASSVGFISKAGPLCRPKSPFRTPPGSPTCCEPGPPRGRLEA